MFLEGERMKLPLEKIGPILRKKRIELGLRIMDLEDEQISKSTISNCERGLPNVTEAMYIYLAEKLEMKHSLLGILGEMEQQEQEAKEQLLELESMISVDPDGSLKKLSEINKTYPISKRTQLYALYTYLLGKCYIEQKKWDKAKRMLMEVVEIAKQKAELTETNLYSACLSNLGRVAFFENQLENALCYTLEGLSVLVLDGERSYFRFHLLLNKGIYLEKMKNPEKAFEAMEELNRELKAITDPDLMLETVNLDVIIQMYNMYGLIYNQLQMHQKALEYTKKGIKIAQRNNYFERLLNLHTTLAIIYSNLGESQLAEKCFLVVLDLHERTKREHSLVFAYVELGQLYIKRKNWTKAEETLEQAIEISERNNDMIHLIECLTALGDCFVQQKRFEQALIPYERAEVLVGLNRNAKKESEIVINLGYCYERLNNQTELEKYQRKAFLMTTKMKWGDLE